VGWLADRALFVSVVFVSIYNNYSTICYFTNRRFNGTFAPVVIRSGKYSARAHGMINTPLKTGFWLVIVFTSFGLFAPANASPWAS
jgi:hypothetical protein